MVGGYIARFDCGGYFYLVRNWGKTTRWFLKGHGVKKRAREWELEQQSSYNQLGVQPILRIWTVWCVNWWPYNHPKRVLLSDLLLQPHSVPHSVPQGFFGSSQLPLRKGIRHFLDNGFKLAVNSWVDAIIYSEHLAKTIQGEWVANMPGGCGVPSFKLVQYGSNSSKQPGNGCRCLGSQAQNQLPSGINLAMGNHIF